MKIAWRRRSLRRTAATVVLPFVVTMVAGPYAPAMAADASRRANLKRVAENLGIDPELLLHPAEYRKQQTKAAKAAREAALADLPRSERPAWHRDELASVRQAQAVHTLGGFIRDVNDGRKVDVKAYGPEVRDLHRKLAKSKVRIVDEVPRGASGALRASYPKPLVAPKRELLQAAPRTWKERRAWPTGLLLAVPAPEPSDTAPTLDAPSDHPLIVAKAQALGGDPIRIYNFVHDTLKTELYYGSKKGAVGTLREGAGNDYDQASLLIALLRATGVAAHYETGNLLLTAAQANDYGGADELSASASLLVSAGVPVAFESLGPNQGMGLRMEHAWVRAYVPTTAYRGVPQVGAVNTWVHLSPSIKKMRNEPAVELRDAVTFDFDGYLAHVTARRPVEVYQDQLRAAIQQGGISCETLADAQRRRTIVPDNLPILPSELPARRVKSLATFAEVPNALRHVVKVTGYTSQGAQQLSWVQPSAGLWGKALTMTYEPASDADAALIQQYGGIESTPAYAVKVRATLKVDAQPVAAGAGEALGLRQRLVMDLLSPATGLERHEHNVTTGGVYGYAVDPGNVPEDLVTEHKARLTGLSGDDQIAQRLVVTALSYFQQLDQAREDIAGYFWHRSYKEVDAAQAAIDPQVNAYGSTPLSIRRAYFVFDAPTRFGALSVDGRNTRMPTLIRLTGHEGSFLEHRVGEIHWGAPNYSAVKLVQQANDDGVTVVTMTAADLDEKLPLLAWPEEHKQTLSDYAFQGYYIQAPARGTNVPNFGMMYGFIGTDLSTGAGAYMVNFSRTRVNGGGGPVGSPPATAGGIGGPNCDSCGGSAPSESAVDIFSGNYFFTVSDLSLPAPGIPLSSVRTYSSYYGWRFNYEQKVAVQPDGSLVWTNHQGVGVRFAAAESGHWTPPPRYFQRVDAVADGFAMTFPDGLVYKFDSAGRLVSQRDLNGHQVTVGYGADGRLATASAAGGAQLAFHRNADGRIDRIADSAGREVSFDYDSAGNLVADHDVLDHIQGYGYDSAGRMIHKTNRRGHPTAIYYDDIGHVVRVVDPEGGVFSYAYDMRNRRILFTDREEASTLYELGDVGLPIRIVDPLGEETRKTYDARGNLTLVRDARGLPTEMTYYGDGSLHTQKNALGKLTQYTYTDYARLETVIDDNGVTTTRNLYDSAGNLQSTEDALHNLTTYTYVDGMPRTIARPGGSITTMEYYADGQVKSMTDPMANTTTMTYDDAGHLETMTAAGATRTMETNAAGQMLSMTDPLTATTTFTYDEDGNRLTVTDSEQKTTNFTYDRLGRLVTTTDPELNTTRSEYDHEGRVTARIDARGYRTAMVYDELGRLVSTTDPNGAQTTTAYCADHATQPCATVDALGNVTTLTEDELGREILRQDPLGNVTRTTYDNLGRRRSVIDAAGYGTTFDYDDAGRLTTVTDAKTGVTTYGYDGRGNRTSVTDANGNTTTFEYDLSNRLFRETTPIGGITEYTYDAAGNRATKVDGKQQRTTFSYDLARRLTDITYVGDTPPAHFEYDSRGNKTLERNGDSERHLAYDSLGRLTHVEDVTVGHDLDYAHDAAGNRVSMTVYPEEEVTTYAWDARGLLSRMTDPDGGEYVFSHDALGRRVHTAYPNGMTLTILYDAASRVLAMVYRSAQGDIIESFGYEYDARGNRLHKVFADGTYERYGYDELSRLTSAAYPTRQVRYTYDAVGNRTRMDEGAPGGTAATCTSDKDCDGYLDARDNCPTIANPTQADTDHPAAAGLAGGWSMNEMSGATVNDLTGRNPGTIPTGGPSRVDGRFGGGLQGPFGGGVKIATSPSLEIAGSGLTISAWLKPGAGDYDGGTVVNKHNNYWLSVTNYAQPAGKASFGFQTNLGLVASNPSLNRSQWNHVVATFDGSYVRLYVNGVLDLEASKPGTLTKDTYPLFLGCQATTACYTGGYGGAMDEVGIWPRALSTSEIALLAKEPLQGDGTGEVCDPCPQSADQACVPLTCLDADGDGYGVAGASSCPGGAAKIDCNDGNAAVHPGGQEVCGDGLDNDCDARADEGCLAGGKTTVYTYNAFNQLLAAGKPVTLTSADLDGDGVANASDNCPSVYNPSQQDSDAPSVSSMGNPLAWWRFNDAPGSTTAADALGSYPATLQGGAQIGAGRGGDFGGALVLDGSTGHAVVSGSLSSGLSAGMTAEAWVYANAAAGSSSQRGILSEQNVEYYQMYMFLALEGAPARLFVGLRNNFAGGFYAQLQDGTAFPTGQWQHVATSFDGSKLRLYRGGAKVGEMTPPAQSPLFGTSPWWIGRGLTQYWNGKIDEMAVYGRVLSDAEIQGHAQAQWDGVGDACDACVGNPSPQCAPGGCTDQDGDGYGPQGASSCSAGQPGKLDCDDGDATIYPGATDIPDDGRDNDCDGVVDGRMAEAKTYYWDGNGNLISEGRQWDARDRLVSGGYGYDTGNLRVKMGEQTVLLDGIEEAREYGAEDVRWEHDPSRVDGLLAQKSGAGKGYFVTDALGSVYGVVDASGAVVSKYGYDVYGARTASSEGMATAWGFTGRKMNGTRAAYFRHRYYDWELGRFLSRDPFKLVDPDWPGASAAATRALAEFIARNPGQQNPYVGLGNSPASLGDPDGRWVQYLVGGLILAGILIHYALKMDDAYQAGILMGKTHEFEEAGNRLRLAIVNAQNFLVEYENRTPCKEDRDEVEKELRVAQEAFFDAGKRVGKQWAETPGSAEDFMGDLPLELASKLLVSLAALPVL